MAIFSIVGMFACGYKLNYSKVREEFIQKGLKLGCLQYKLTDPTTGKVELCFVSEKKKELTNWFNDQPTMAASISYEIKPIPVVLYSDHSGTNTLTGLKPEAEKTR